MSTSKHSEAQVLRRKKVEATSKRVLCRREQCGNNIDSVFSILYKGAKNGLEELQGILDK
jgi:hypothetical protein